MRRRGKVNRAVMSNFLLRLFCSREQKVWMDKFCIQNFRSLDPLFRRIFTPWELSFHLGTLVPECSVLGMFAPLCLYCDVMQPVFYVGLLTLCNFVIEQTTAVSLVLHLQVGCPGQRAIKLLSSLWLDSHHPSLLHSFTPGSKPTFSTNPFHLRLLYLLDCLHDNGTGPDLSRSSIYF